MKLNKIFLHNFKRKQTNEYTFFSTKHNKMPPNTTKLCSPDSNKYEFDIYASAQ